MKLTTIAVPLAALSLCLHASGLYAANTTVTRTAESQDTLPELEQGLILKIYDIGRPIQRLHPLRPDQTPNVHRKLDTLDLATPEAFGGPTEYFFAEAMGYLSIDEPGDYAFELISDDGSRLRIDDAEIINHDGLHAATGKQASTFLTEGLHRFHIDMFNNQGGAGLGLRWRPPGADAFATVPPEAFKVEKGLTLVVAPGRKVILDGKEHLRPGSGMPLESVHPMWTVETVRPEGVRHRIGGMDFLPNGSLVYSEFVPVNNGVLREKTNGTLWMLEDIAGDEGRANGTPIKIAEGLHDPSGVACVGTDIYVSHRPGIELFKDTDGDGTYETRETFAEPWVGDNYHHFSFGLQTHKDKDGPWLYGSLSTSIYFDNTLDKDDVQGEVIGLAGPNPPNRGTLYRINLETRDIEWLAGGFRTPNGVHVDSKGRMFVTENQGAWHPGNRLNNVKPGRFYGHYNGLQKSNRYPQGGSRSNFMEGGEYPPAVWLPQNDVSNSPTTPLEITDGPFEGQYWLAELTAGGIRRVFLEEVNSGRAGGGELQGAVFRHTQGLECGVNRLLQGPDGCLYAGGIGADGNWNWRGTQYGLQRLRPTGETAFEFHSIQAMPDGYVLRFTKPVDPDWLANPANYAISQWDYFSTPEYGGPRRNEQRLAVTKAIPGRSGDTVRLVVPGLREGSVVHFRCDARHKTGTPSDVARAEELDTILDASEEARRSDLLKEFLELFTEPMWSNEAWYTLNQIPPGTHAPGDQDTAVRPLDNDFLDGFREPQGDWLRTHTANAAGNAIEHAGDEGLALIAENSPRDDAESVNNTYAILINGKGNTNDLRTTFEHGDVAASLEFMIPEGSNSGVYFQSRYEIQIFDSYGKAAAQHDDMGGIYQRWDPSRGPGNEGYEGVPPRINAANKPGEWNTLNVIFRAPRFDPYGRKVANARFESVVLNGQTIHENVELTGPTRVGAPGEVPFAPLRLQGDHGPVAYRNISLRPLGQNEDPNDPFPGLDEALGTPFHTALKNKRVLLFTKTAGFRHASIPDGIACFRELAKENGFTLEHTEDAGAFIPATLRRYDAVVFLNTTGDVLDNAQQYAFQRWYQNGGAYLGVHAASDTEFDWPWYGELVGAYFQGHPQIQPARMVIASPDHPAVAHLGGFPHFKTWTRTDEWYDFRAQPAEGTRPLLYLDPYTYRGGKIGGDDTPRRTHPIAWYREFEGGRTIYTGGGHTKASYSEPGFRQHLLGALAWALDQDPDRDD